MTDFVVRVPGRRLFLRWEGPRVHHGLVEYADGTGGAGSVELPEGPAFGSPGFWIEWSEGDVSSVSPQDLADEVLALLRVWEVLRWRA